MLAILCKEHPTIFGRAFTQVSLVAWNVINLSQQDYLMAFVSGTLVSYVWWMNSRAAALTQAVYGQHAYALGAGCGTLFGMVLGSLL